MKTVILTLLLLLSTSLFGSELRDDALKAYLVGTWVGAESKPGSSSEQTFYEDGTYEGLVVITGRSASGAEVERRLAFSGVWKVEGDVCVETTQKLNPQIAKVPDTRRYRITNVTESTHRSTNTETQKSSVHRRKTG